MWNVQAYEEDMKKLTVRCSFDVLVDDADDRGTIDFEISRALSRAYERSRYDEQGYIQSFLKKFGWVIIGLRGPQ